MEGVDLHACVRDALGRQLLLIVAEAEAEFVREAMPVGLHASGSSCSPGADRALAAAVLANAGRVRWGLKGVDRIVVDPKGAVQSSVVEAAKGRASPRDRGRRRGSGGSRGRLPHAASVGRSEPRRSAPREKPLDASHENVEGRSGVSLPEDGPKWAAANRPTKPSMQKLLISLSRHRSP